MWTRQHRPNRSSRLIMPTLCVAVLSYFGYHVYHGEFGITSKYVLRQQAAELKTQFDAVHEKRVEIERRVALLHDGSIDRDMLDEQARGALSLSRSDEVTIMVTSQNPG